MFGKVLDKNVPSADGQLLNSCSNSQLLLYRLIVLGLPKLLLKESTIAEFLPSASTFINTFVGSSSVSYLYKFPPTKKSKSMERFKSEIRLIHSLSIKEPPIIVFPM